MSEHGYNGSDVRIAIIGMAGRFPGAATPNALWANLCEGVESITFFERDEIDPSIDRSVVDDPRYVRARGVMEDADKFDAGFFGMSPREAEIMDPQHRILLEVAHETFENAGYVPRKVDGLIGVFAGAGFNNYLLDNVFNRADVIESIGRHSAELANAPDYLTTRISYKFDLKGPSVSLFTGCSSSLVAVCYGVESLLSYQCDMALTGGVHIATPLRSGYMHYESDMGSTDGHTRPFDHMASGTVFSSGCGMVLLKRFDEAIEDRDHVYAVIRGVGLNNDGGDKVSFTAPSVRGQATAVAMAHANAGVTPKMISYVEAHGTGTPIGDPIEVESLTRAFRSNGGANQYCAIGSVKGNIGHLDAAAGIAGLIKTSLALYHKRIPASINFDRPNPKIDFGSTPFYVNVSQQNWQAGSAEPRIAGVSSFGVGGTNAHVVLEEAPGTTKPETASTSDSGTWRVLPISAKTVNGLESLSKRLCEYLATNQELNLDDIALTLQTGRSHYNHRRAVVCEDLPDALEALTGSNGQKVVTSSRIPVQRDVVYMFSGQGSQYPGMGRDLYRRFAVFKDEVDRCSELLTTALGMDLRNIIFPQGSAREAASALIHETYVTQPSLFVIEYALAKLWMSLGVSADAYVGHSIGEYVAACLGGVFSLEDALQLVAVRGKLMQTCERGTMLAVLLPEDELRPIIRDGVSIAAINAPSACVVSGATAHVEQLGKELAARNVTTRALHTSRAFHSQMMEPVIQDFVRAVQEVVLKTPSTAYLSNLTGSWIRPEEATDPAYWGNQLRHTVRFNDCLKTLMQENGRVFLEVGPGSTLRALAAQHLDDTSDHLVVSSLPHVKESISDEGFFLRSLGTLWAGGHDIQWASLSIQNARRIPLPTYPFERTRHWIEPATRMSVSESKIGSESLMNSIEKTESEELQNRREVSSESGNRSTTQTTVVEIWRAALGYSGIGLDDNFFDLGGNSLMGANIIAQLRSTFSASLSMADIYDAPTVRKLSEIIERAMEDGAEGTAAQSKKISLDRAADLIG